MKKKFKCRVCGKPLVYGNYCPAYCYRKALEQPGVNYEDYEEQKRAWFERRRLKNEEKA